MDGSGPMQATGSAPSGGVAAGVARTGPSSPTTWRRWILRNLGLAGLVFVAVVVWLRLSRPASVYPWETQTDAYGNARFLCAWAPSEDVPTVGSPLTPAVPLAAIPGGPAATAHLWPQGTFGPAGPAAYWVQIRRIGALVSTRTVAGATVFRSIDETGPDGRSWTMFLVQPTQLTFDEGRRGDRDLDLCGRWTLRLAAPVPTGASGESGPTSIVNADGAPPLPAQAELSAGRTEDLNWRSQGRALAIQIKSAAQKNGNATGVAWNTVVGALDATRRSFEGRDMWGRAVLGTKEDAK